MSVTSCATDIHFDTYLTTFINCGPIRSRGRGMNQVKSSHLTTWQTTFGSLPASDPLSCKQSLWDRPGILASLAVIESSISDPIQMATFLAASAPYSGDWLLALPVSSCGMKLNDDAVRVAVSLRLGCSICVSHTCRCGATVDVQGQQGLICKQPSPSRVVRHNVMNNIIFRSLSSAGITASKESTSQTRLDGKRSDGLTLVPWQGDKPVTWNIIVVSTFAQSYLHASGQSAAGTAELAVSRNGAKYSCLPRVFFLYQSRSKL